MDQPDASDGPARRGDLTERPVLVTGTSSGIGLATALHLAGLGFRVFASVRSADKAKLVEAAATEAGVEVETVVLDVTDPGSCEDLVPHLDLWGLVNNAGHMEVGTVDDVPEDVARRQFDTLVFAPMRLVKLALPAMRCRGDGRIVNVTSAAAHLTGPLLGWYGAAKHALAALTDALRPEVAGWGVDVVAVEPGATRTAIWDGAVAGLDHLGPDSATPQAYARGRSVVRALRPRMAAPESVAARIGDALAAGRPRPVYRVGWDAVLLPPAARLVPARARDRLVRTILRL